MSTLLPVQILRNTVTGQRLVLPIGQDFVDSIETLELAGLVKYALYEDGAVVPIYKRNHPRVICWMVNKNAHGRGDSFPVPAVLLEVADTLH